MIDTSDYKKIADYIAYSFSLYRDSIDVLSTMKVTSNNIDLPSNDVSKVDLINKTSNSYTVVSKRYSNAASVFEAEMVRRLQMHILSAYGSVDEYLENKNIKVLSDFAAISRAVGYPISDSNIG